MSKQEKLKLKKLTEPARSDITFNEMDLFLHSMGFVKKRSNSGGSHRLYTHKDSKFPVNIQSANGLVKKYQVTQVQKIIKMIQRNEEE